MIDLPCEKCLTLIQVIGNKDRHRIPVLCAVCEKAEYDRLKRTQKVDCHPRSEAQKKREPF